VGLLVKKFKFYLFGIKFYNLNKVILKLFLLIQLNESSFIHLNKVKYP
jgi:hypothetical protein